PTTAIAISPFFVAGGNGCSGGCGTPSAPSGSRVSAWNTRPIEASIASWPAGASNGTPDRGTAGRNQAGKARPQRLERLAEIGVGAEPAVELDRVGVNLLDRIHRGRRRQQQRVDLPEHMLAHTLQLLELVERRKRIDRGRPRAAENDPARHRMHRLVRRGDQ